MKIWNRAAWMTSALVLVMAAGCVVEAPLPPPVGDESVSAKEGTFSPQDGCDPCDTNCDGRVDSFDIEPFIALLVDPQTQPCAPCAGDINGDGAIDSFDIEPFVLCLSGGGNGNGNQNGNTNGTNGNLNGVNGNTNGTNGNLNGGNGNTNGTNGNLNSVNGNTNGTNGNLNGVNGNTNGTNGNLNGGNGNLNGVNGNTNGTNGNLNGGNGNSNGTLCPDGSFQVRADLESGGRPDGRMIYRELVGGCRTFYCRIDDYPPGSYEMTIEGQFVGFITSDGERGEVFYDSEAGTFPSNFPMVMIGDIGDVGGVASGFFGLNCEANANCNGGGNGNFNGGNGNINGGNGNTNGTNGNFNG